MTGRDPPGGEGGFGVEDSGTQPRYELFLVLQAGQ